MAQAAATGMRFVPDSGTGNKKKSFIYRALPCFGDHLKEFPHVIGSSGRAFVTALDHPSYAVVTFTSRQAAIAARQSLADGGAINTWRQVDDIPIAPLADAPPRNIFFCRGCCRPVTLTINYKEKKFRRYTYVRSSSQSICAASILIHACIVVLLYFCFSFAVSTQSHLLPFKTWQIQTFWQKHFRTRQNCMTPPAPLTSSLLPLRVHFPVSC
jgi:hypothetical protein